MKNIVIYGAGGFGREVKMLIDIINEHTPTWNFLGYIADIDVENAEAAALKIGNIDFINNYSEELYVVLATGSPNGLKIMREKITNPKVIFPTLIHPKVYIHKSVRFGQGNIIMPSCTFTIDIHTGDFNIFNLGACVAHDANIGDYNVIGPNTQISGNITVGNSNLFGVGSVVLEKLSIADNCTIGACSLLTKNAEAGVTYFGMPAFALKKK